MKPTFNLLSDELGYTIETNGSVHINVKPDGSTSIRIGVLFSPKALPLALDETNEESFKATIVDTNSHLPEFDVSSISKTTPEDFFPHIYPCLFITLL
jgi:hypothetical protein